MKTSQAGLFFFSMVILCLGNQAYGYQIKGAVLDERGEPIPYAVVRVQATENATMTNIEGRFTLVIGSSQRIMLTAWKQGYFNGGVELANDQNDVVIELKPVPPDDNKHYLWIPPYPPSTLQHLPMTGDESFNSRSENNCSSCHASFIGEQWRQNAHSNSARNPLLLTMYNGTNMAGEPGVSPGYKIDFPQSKGNCATCHAPAQAIADPWGTDLNEVHGIATQGVFCDFCHKIKDVELHPDGGYPGVLSIRLNRPPEGEQVFYGPFDDAIAGPDTFSPLFEKSRFCAPCHSAQFWGVSIYSEFDEWLESPYPKEGKECQDCHMAPDGVTTHFVASEKGGVKRAPETIATHNNPGSRDVKFLSDAIKMELQVEAETGILEVVVRLTNEKAGHHFPTGAPMRNMILLVEAIDREGRELKYMDDTVVPQWGGVGLPEEGNYAGVPGKGFAKVLRDILPYPDRPTRRDFSHEYPAPHWRPTVVESDNRIQARQSDISTYRFQVPKNLSGAVQVTAKLIFRRAYKKWLDAKGIAIPDMEIARQDFTIQPQRNPNGRQ